MTITFKKKDLWPTCCIDRQNNDSLL